ncbi:hypothetical protein C7B61_00650 [filamentous cyanobacterium CCP1]|nr:hypothetical protein C7B76_00435 [filamentous cyanobacterium CCP2]PSB68486.1 hypothetical protein C7B61_00650 [filamentous cyanobacterium CCP1]
MGSCKATQYWTVGTLVSLLVVGCSPRTTTGAENEATQAQSPSIPEYPPLYNVDVEVCGNIIAPLEGGKRCISTQLQLWGPIGEAKLVQTGVALPSVSAVQHKVAIASKGCYPIYPEPAQEQSYWADTIVQVNRGGEPTTIEMTQTQLSNQQIHELVTGTLSNATAPTFGGAGCEPVPAE